jgi:hypothetical protein
MDNVVVFLDEKQDQSYHLPEDTVVPGTPGEYLFCLCLLHVSILQTSWNPCSLEFFRVNVASHPAPPGKSLFDPRFLYVLMSQTSPTVCAPQSRSW